MPRVKELEVLSDNGTVKKIGIKVKDGDTTKDASYEIPSNASVFRAWVSSLSPSTNVEKPGELEKVYEYFQFAVDMKTRASVRESVAADTTLIKVDGKDVDLLAIAPEKFLIAINGMRGASALAGGGAPRGVGVTARE